MNVPVISWTLSQLSSTWTYFNQILSISSSPVSDFTVSGWSSLVSLITWLLTNPFFYGIILLLLVMTILPTFDDD